MVDKSLIERAKQDPHAFGEIYEMYVDRIYAYIYRRTNDKYISEDITSSAFEAAFKHMNGFQLGENGITPWLYRIARNKLVNYQRRQKFMSPLKFISNKQNNVADPGFVIEIEDNEILNEAFNKISNRDQEIINFRFFEDLSTEEISQILDCKKENVYLRLHRALKKLRREIEALEEEGEESYETA